MTTALISPIVIPARGTELLMHVMHLINVEASTHPCPDEMNEIGRWDQGTWGKFSLRALSEAGFPVDLTGNTLTEVNADVAYTCCTALCVAGHTVLAAGDDIVLSGGSGARVNTFSGHVWMDNVRACDGPRAGQLVDVESRAAELLDLDTDEVAALFAGNNTLSDVQAAAAMVASNRHRAGAGRM